MNYLLRCGSPSSQTLLCRVPGEQEATFLGSDRLRSEPRQYRRRHQRRRHPRRKPSGRRSPSCVAKPAPADDKTARLYSATRSLSRKAGLRPVAMAREMADTVLPRYKVDASGDLVPGRAAPRRPSSTTPKPTKCSGKRTHRAQRSIASITKVMTATVFLENNPDLTAAGHHRAQRRVPGVDDAPARQRPRDGRRPAAPAAHRVRQRRRPGAGARVAVRARKGSSRG